MIIFISLFIISVFAVNNSQKNIPTNEFQLFQSFNPLNLLKQDLASISLQENKSLTATIVLNKKEEPKLATVVNNKDIFSDSYTITYLEHYNNLSKVNFENLTKKSSALLKAGNADTKIEGFILNDKKYAIHLVGCNKEKGTCNFRINGALAKDLSPDRVFGLDGNYSVKIKSIKFDYCDNRRVCDYLLQSYDLAEIEVVEKQLIR